MKRIYKKLQSRNVDIRHACEIGVYMPETSNIIDFIKAGTRATLVEADPDTVAHIHSYFAGYDVTVHPVAVWDTDGTLKFSKAASSTFATELPNSPALENDRYQIREDNTFEVPCKRFSEIDDGSIDLLSIDIEGGEWYAIKHLRSPVKVLSIETHGKYYTNPFINEIRNWIREHDYVLWYEDPSDSVFIKRGLFKPDFPDRLETALVRLRIRWKKFKRIFKRK